MGYRIFFNLTVANVLRTDLKTYTIFFINKNNDRFFKSSFKTVI